MQLYIEKHKENCKTACNFFRFDISWN